MKRTLRSGTAFTLIELLSVVLLIALLAGLIVGTTGYLRDRTATAQARSEIAALELALEAYRQDHGYYPPSTAVRVSYTGRMEASNCLLLVQALTRGPKKYYSVASNQFVMVAGMTVLGDPWRNPYNYYRPPLSSEGTSISNFFAGTVLQERWLIGGLVNAASFDLVSYGRDGRTYGGGLWTGAKHDQPRYAEDDIANYK